MYVYILSGKKKGISLPFRVYIWFFVGYIGDEILPSYAGIVWQTIPKGSLVTNQDSMESKRLVFFVRGSTGGDALFFALPP